ncbi:MAG: zinc metalloprotease HtpX [Methyloligellaceae bacterium]
MQAGPFLDAASKNEHGAHNFFHTVLLMACLASIMIFCSWLLAGIFGVIIASLLFTAFAYISTRIPGQVVMRMYRGKQVNDDQLNRIVEILSDRAELAATPRLYVIPSSTLNAFATGSQKSPFIAITEGLLRRLDLKEVSAVLAHEISHIRNNDLKLMALADATSRVTQLMSFVGIILILANLPLWLVDADGFPWLAAILLYLAPTLGNLLQLALSRTREYDADLEGASLTGEPQSLINALEKLEEYQGAVWEDMFFPGRRIPQPCLLRSHPPTHSRVEKLKGLQPVLPPITVPTTPIITMVGAGPVTLHPRYHFPWPGIWY